MELDNNKEESPAPFSKEWWRKLGQVFSLAGKDFLVDNGPSWAAALAYYALLSLFPLLLASVSLAAHFVDPSWAAAEIARRLGDFLPAGEETIQEIVQQAHEAGAGVGIVSILFLLWSGSYVFGVLTIALNIFYDVEETYGFLKRTFIRLLMLATLGLLLALALSSRLLLHLLSDVLEVFNGDTRGIVFQLVRAMGPILLLFLSLFLIYRFVPRKRPNWRAAVFGATLATLAMTLAQPLFSTYLQRFGTDYNIIYGSLGIGIVLLFWAWIVSLILLLGGELSSHAQALLVEGQSTEEVQKHHLQRSPNRADRQAPEKRD